MPEYIAPGVFVEETGRRPAAIAGIGTDRAGFVGPCRFGPVGGVPALLTTYAEFERLHGGLEPLDFGAPNATPNCLAHAVRAYFAEGGRRLYVARVYAAPADGDGFARWPQPPAPGAAVQSGIALRARYPGAAGSLSVSFGLTRGESKLRVKRNGKRKLARVAEGDVVWAQRRKDARREPPGAGKFYRVVRQGRGLRLGREGANKLWKARAFETVHLVSVSVVINAPGAGGSDQSWTDLVFDPAAAHSIFAIFAVKPTQAANGSAPLVFERAPRAGDALATALAQLPNEHDAAPLGAGLDSANPALRSAPLQLAGGSDGREPAAFDYAGNVGNDDGIRGLRALEAVDDIAMVAAPGAADAAAIHPALVAHCERLQYRVAVLDPPRGASLGQLRALRQGADSSRAALYYPWVQIDDPLSGAPMLNPPSGHVCGIYARNDIEHGVHRAPANEVVRLATGLEVELNNAQQDLLNPQGINCLRFFAGRGIRVWGARTLSTDAQWKYLNLRRYFIYLERSISLGTEWTVFEPNAQPLWDRIRTAIESFLLNEWRSNRIQGSKPEDAFFVRCDRSTMTQADIENGRLICLVGVAALKPAEFVILQIVQQTTGEAP